MSLHGAFLQSILESPEDDTPRLVYADWLDENGDPERAEFIRTQVETARLAPNDLKRRALEKQTAALLKAHGKEWVRPLADALRCPRGSQLHGWTFRRGFVEEVALYPHRPDFLTAAADALAHYPVVEVSLTDSAVVSLDEALAELARAGPPGLRSLWVWGSTSPAPAALRLLACSPRLPHLTRLRLSTEVPGPLFDSLLGTPLAARLRGLSLQVYHWTDGAEDVFRMLRRRAALPALESLELTGDTLGDEGLGALAGGPGLRALRALDVDDCTIGPRGLAALLGSRLWPRLERLGLKDAPVGEGSLKGLASALAGAGLRDLSLITAGITAAGVKTLASTKSWGRLEALDLWGNGIGDAGLVALASCPHLAQLRRLDLRGCGAGEGGTMALANSPHAGGLQELWMYEGQLDRAPLMALRKRFREALRWTHK